MIACILLAWVGSQMPVPWWYWALLSAYAWYRLIAAIVMAWQKGGERLGR